MGTGSECEGATGNASPPLDKGRTLVIGYGNLDRGDDGVAFEVVNGLRRRLSQLPLDEEQTGLDQLGTAVDSAFVHQLGPELLELAAGYDQIIFVDAHVQSEGDALSVEAVGPAYAVSAFTHHMTPGMFAALFKALYDRAPAAFVVSIQGTDFQFRRGLSPLTAGQVAPAVDTILALACHGTPN